jgi:hypothetical protein
MKQYLILHVGIVSLSAVLPIKYNLSEWILLQCIHISYTSNHKNKCTATEDVHETISHANKLISDGPYCIL